MEEDKDTSDSSNSNDSGVDYSRPFDRFEKGLMTFCTAGLLGIAGFMGYGVLNNGNISQEQASELESRALYTLTQKANKVVGEEKQTRKSGQELLDILKINHKLKPGQKVLLNNGFYPRHEWDVYKDTASVEINEYDETRRHDVIYSLDKTNAESLKKYLKVKWGEIK